MRIQIDAKKYGTYSSRTLPLADMRPEVINLGLRYSIGRQSQITTATVNRNS